jgi:hypothetical protein
VAELLGRPLAVANAGVDLFADELERQDVRVERVEWRPPEPGSEEALARLASEAEAIARANDEAVARMEDAQPMLASVGVARDLLPDMGERTILHAGPPIDWADMSGPLRGAVLGAAVYEGLAGDLDEAERLAASGAFEFGPCHERGAVGPMAGVISPSMPVWRVADRARGNRAFCNLNEGLGKVLRFGANGPEVLGRLRWMGEVLAPALGAALEVMGGLDLKPLIAQALHMGDEVHNRNVAASSLLLKRLVPALLRTGVAPAEIAAVVDFVAGNDHFFLNLSMAACKAMLDAAAGVPGSSMVTAMARNGVDFGIRLSGTGDAWFTAPAPVVDGLLFPGYTSADAAPDLGDSAITETAGLGGFAMAASPAIVQFVGGAPQDAIANSLEMGPITLGRNGAFTLPALDFTGTPAGIDARKVVDTGIAPIINTGIAHRQAGIGQIGAGITRAPLACFAKAIRALAEQVEAA